MNVFCIRILHFLILHLIFKSHYTVNSQAKEERVKLTEVQVITLYKDQYTNSRRLPPIPQLKCVGSFWKCQTYSPNFVQCYNKGYDGLDVQWECKANLDKSVRFGIIKVMCEGYNFPQDPFILAGSCGLEYTLELSRTNRNYDYYNTNLYETSKLSNFLTLLIMVVIILAVYKTCNKNRENEIRREINSTYAHIIDGTEYNALACSNTTTATSASNLFPPPPPPYRSVVGNVGPSVLNSAGLITPSTCVSQHEATTQTPIPNTELVTGSSSLAATQTTTTTTALSPLAVNATDLTNLKPAENVNIVNESVHNSSPNTWDQFLTTTSGVAGYLLNRRNASPNRINETTRRSDSPPPAYEDARGENSILSSTGLQRR